MTIERFKGRELDDRETVVLGHIENHGWNVTNVREEHGAPGWAFTIGLFENFGHPEVIIFGLKQESRHSILNWIGESVRNGKRLTAGEEHDWVLEDYKCFSREVQKDWYGDLVGWAMWFYGGPDFPLVQCLWPSRDGSYPWQDDHSPQPLLYESEIVRARMMPFSGEKDWPFPTDPNKLVFVSRCVVEDEAPIVLVVHETDGDWQFIGPVEDPEADGIKLACFRHIVESHPEMRVHAKLAAGWAASRNIGDDRWEITPADSFPE